MSKNDYKKGLIGKYGVYIIKIEGIVRYVGSGELESRYSNHKSRLKNNKHGKKLQKLYDEAGGLEVFEFEVLKYCNKSDTYILEQEYMQLYKDTIVNKKGINSTKKQIRRGKSASKHKEKFRELFQGENNPNAKLSIEDVIVIKTYMRDKVYTDREIAKMFNISISHVNSIRNGLKWASVNIENIKEKEVSTAIDTSVVASTSANVQAYM